MSQLINLLRGGRRVLYQHAGTPNIAKVGSILYTTVPTWASHLSTRCTHVAKFKSFSINIIARTLLITCDWFGIKLSFIEFCAFVPTLILKLKKAFFRYQDDAAIAGSDAKVIKRVYLSRYWCELCSRRWCCAAFMLKMNESLIPWILETSRMIIMFCWNVRMARRNILPLLSTQLACQVCDPQHNTKARRSILWTRIQIFQTSEQVASLKCDSNILHPAQTEAKKVPLLVTHN